jgi:cholesterol transport system auxiliary component
MIPLPRLPKSPLRRALSKGRMLGLVSMLPLVAACSSLLSPADIPLPARYSFDRPPSAAHPASVAPGAPTLVVNLPHAAAGFDSQHMFYVRQPHQLEYFAQNEWVDTPASMLLPLITSALDHTGVFAAVLPAASGVQGQFMLDVELVRLQHEFLSKPSQVHLTLRAYLLDSTTRQVVAWREFDTQVAAPSENPYGGVVAANAAVHVVLAQMAAFCREVVLPKH